MFTSPINDIKPLRLSKFVIKIINSYLTDRNQSVFSINGVPQGSILVPLLSVFTKITFHSPIYPISNQYVHR